MTKDLALEHKWKGRVEEYHQSGLSIRNWCYKNELKETTFKYWLHKFNKSGQKSATTNTDFVEVLLPGAANISKKTVPESVSTMINLSYQNYSITIADGFNPVTLTELIKVLQKL